MQQQEYDTGADMTTKSAKHSHRYLARFALLLLVVIPFVPEIVITTVVALARRKGCVPDQACRIGSLAVNDIIDWGLRAGAGARVAASDASLPGFYLAIAGWLVMCYIVLNLGWARVASRLLLGLAVALVFALLPYFGPSLSIASLINEDTCPVNNKGIYDPSLCKIFGGKLSDPDIAARALLDLPHGGLLAIGVFVIYAVVVVVTGAVSARRPVETEQQNA
jgi:hypothetical protein